MNIFFTIAAYLSKSIAVSLILLNSFLYLVPVFWWLLPKIFYLNVKKEDSITIVMAQIDPKNIPIENLEYIRAICSKLSMSIGRNVLSSFTDGNLYCAIDVEKQTGISYRQVLATIKFFERNGMLEWEHNPGDLNLRKKYYKLSKSGRLVITYLAAANPEKTWTITNKIKTNYVSINI